ncbi:MAG: sulfatase-like hydrolase/transferase, partial [Planctomycetales bacterium]|nr:sulfatase-like hydrolase/transferase [Planctomycetales bacterium]
KEFITANQERPFFLYLPFAIPHLSIQVPEADVAAYRDEIQEEEYVHKGYLQHPTPRAGYAGMVTMMDRGVGEVMQLLKDLKLDDNTVVLFTSDNGPTYDRLGGSDSDYFASADGMRGLKGSLYEGGIRVPLVVRWPGHITPGGETDLVAAFWDLLPTCCDIAGTTPPEGLDGVSLLPTWTGQPGQRK